MRAYYAKRRHRVVELKSGKECARCGIDDPRVLDFHHRDPSTKLFQVSAAAWKVSSHRLQAELDKCDVLCANCHRILHFEQRENDRKAASA